MNKEIYDGYKYTEKLLPCPWCGKDRHAVPYMNERKIKTCTGKTEYTVSCGGCGAEPEFHVNTEQEAIDVWNNRVNFQDTEACILGFNIAKKEIIKIIKKLGYKIEK